MSQPARWHWMESREWREKTRAVLCQVNHYVDEFGAVDLDMIARAAEVSREDLTRIQEYLRRRREWHWRGKHPDPPSFVPTPRQIREACAEIQKEWTPHDWEVRAQRHPLPWDMPRTKGVEYRKGVAS